MLSREENERLTRVGPDTPMGKLLRRYWLPACMSSELPEKDGAPLRVRLLGEDLVAFRDTEGKVGLVDAYCPHRRAPLFFGRNEECGLRCVYHGWKFDRHGDCVDMPSEPAGTTLQAKVKIRAYPTFEQAGLVWCYMGPPELQPAKPDYDWMRAPKSHAFVSKTYENCNWLQALEGGLDTAHSSFAHNNKIGDNTMLRNRDRAPRIDVERTDYGYTYVSTRNLGPDGSYVRVYHYFMPFQQVRAQVIAWDGKIYPVARNFGHLWMPIDDVTTHVYNWHYAINPGPELSDDLIEHHEKEFGRGPGDNIPGTFRLKRNQSNDYLIDRQVQKTKTFTGIEGVNTQDYALQEGMGPICDRSKEFLGTSDKAIVAMRRLLLEATRVNEVGGTPKGLDPEAYAKQRAYDALVPMDEDWRKVMEDDLVAKW
jgi:phenylpropionate dioxygenase-like ring-hydroxylating dioxygenase large terminal subunit